MQFRIQLLNICILLLLLVLQLYDPLLIPLLISFGLNEFSVSATSVLATRAAINKWTKEEADLLAEKALSLATEKEVMELLKSSVR